MAAVLFTIEPLCDALEHNTLLLTANNRQRNQILRAYHEFQQTEKSSWRQPRIFSLRQWIEQQWQALLLGGHTEITGTIANNWQSLALWEQVIESSSASRLLRQREPPKRRVKTWTPGAAPKPSLPRLAPITQTVRPTEPGLVNTARHCSATN